MTLNKAIEHGKEKRKQYRDPQSYDPTSRCHGGDYWFEENRLHSTNKRKERLEDEMKDDCREQ